MFRSIFNALDLEARAERMRSLHGAWLTRALQRGSRPPRIPVRAVGNGGWAALMETAEGRAWADEFWEHAFEHPDAE